MNESEIFWDKAANTYDKAEKKAKVFTRCGLCNLCQNEGVPEFVPSLCETDYITMCFAGCKLERPTTIGKGDDCCNFYITRK